VREYPETTFVLNHYGTPVGLLGPRGKSTGANEAERSSMLAAWREDVSALAELPNVVAKHSGLGMPILGEGVATADRLAPLIRHLHDAFGPERTMWASNFPMDKPKQTLPASLRLVTDVLGEDADLDLLVRDVARRVYRL
jgi:predicted TIM-barrel fold metal-dependent hydrolase